jgi:hypothetical protein
MSPMSARLARRIRNACSAFSIDIAIQRTPEELTGEAPNPKIALPDWLEDTRT